MTLAAPEAPGRGVGLRPYQEQALQAIAAARARGVQRQLVVLPTGCHRAGQRLLMFDGSMKRVEDVVVGDLLMGPDSRPREVLQLARGRGPMVEIRPVKGDPWVVNDQHILTLVRTNGRNPNPRRNGGRVFPSEGGGMLVDVNIADYQRWSANAKHLHKLQRFAVDFAARAEGPIDAYLLGLLLGDGSLSHPRRVALTTTDSEVEDHVTAAAADIGLHVRRRGITLHLEGQRGPGTNPLVEDLRDLGLLPIECARRFVPDDYRLGSTATRLGVLAGLLDADGSARDGCYEFVSKSPRLADDVAFIARSVGLAAYTTSRAIEGNYGSGTFWRVSISGDCASIPCRIARRRHRPRRQVKDVTRTGFTIASTGTVEDYYGFTLAGDGRYLLADFTVTHNTGKTVTFSELARRLGGRTLILAHRDELLRQAADKLRTVAPELAMSIGFVQAGRDESGYPVVVASVQTLARERRLRALPRDFDLVIVDEAHRAAAKSYGDILEHVNADLVVGFTATPERNDAKDLHDTWHEIVFARSLLEMIAAGYLCDLRGIRVHLADLDLSQIRVTAGDFQSDELAQAMSDAHAPEQTAIAIREHAPDRKCVVFCASVELAAQTAEAMRRAGIATEHVHGGTPRDERARILADFAEGRLQAVTNVDVLTEGYDNPGVDCVVIAAPTKSRIAYAQRVGRGTRLYPGKEDCLVLDLVGSTEELSLQSLPTLFSLKREPRPGETMGQAAAREAKEDEAHTGVQLDDAPRPVGAEEVDLLAGRAQLRWVMIGQRWVISAGNGDDGNAEYLVLDPVDGGNWRVLLLCHDHATILASGLDIGYAQGSAEETLRSRDGVQLADKQARWRQKEATTGQLRYLANLGVTRQVANAGEATDAITEVLAGRLLARMDAAVARRRQQTAA